MKEIHPLFCKFGQHIYELRNAIVTYPPEVGGLDVYEMARECAHCERQEIMAPLERKYMEVEKFNRLYGTTTLIKGG